MDRLRHHIGRHLYYWGFLIQPRAYRRGLACMSALGVAWAKANEAELLDVMSGKISIEWHWRDAERPTPPQEPR